MEIITALNDTPIPTILVIGGLLLMFLGVATIKKPIVIDVAPSSRRIALILGIVLVGTGIYLLSQPSSEQLDTDKFAEEPVIISTPLSTEHSIALTPSVSITILPTAAINTPTPIPSYASILVGISEISKFRESSTWHNYFCLGTEMCAVGDFNSDGKADVVTFVGDGKVFVALSDGTKFGEGIQWSGWFCLENETCVAGDVNGDGKTDVITFVGDGRVFVALSDGTKFGEGVQWNDSFCLENETCVAGDVNGDGKTDVITFVDDGRVFVALSDGTRFGDGTIWNDHFCAKDEICNVGDVNGDGRVDLVVFQHGSKP